jgi:MoxR-like ATPase
VGTAGAPEIVNDMAAWGAGPRAVQFLILGGKARALLNGRPQVSTDDIAALAKPVLRHRVVVNFAAESDGITPDKIVDELLRRTPTNEDELTRDDRFQKIFAS